MVSTKRRGTVQIDERAFICSNKNRNTDLQAYKMNVSSSTQLIDTLIVVCAHITRNVVN